MKKPFAVLTTLFFLALAAVGCATPAGTDSDVAGVQVWTDAMLAAQTAGDLDATMAIISDDAVFMPSDGTLLGDPSAIRAYWEDLYSKGDLEPQLSDEELQADGDWGFVRGTWTVSASPEDGGEPERASSYFIVVVHREADGTWKLARVIWHPAQPATEE